MIPFPTTLIFIAIALSPFVSCEIVSVEKVTALNVTQSDQFGTSISTYNDYIIVGAPNNDEISNNAGTAYIFKIHPISKIVTQTQQLFFNYDVESGDNCGISVSISNKFLIVGCYDCDVAGCAFIYTLNETETDTSKS